MANAREKEILENIRKRIPAGWILEYAGPDIHVLTAPPRLGSVRVLLIDLSGNTIPPLWRRTALRVVRYASAQHIPPRIRNMAGRYKYTDAEIDSDHQDLLVAPYVNSHWTARMAADVVGVADRIERSSMLLPGKEMITEADKFEPRSSLTPAPFTAEQVDFLSYLGVRVVQLGDRQSVFNDWADTSQGKLRIIRADIAALLEKF